VVLNQTVILELQFLSLTHEEVFLIMIVLLICGIFHDLIFILICSAKKVPYREEHGFIISFCLFPFVGLAVFCINLQFGLEILIAIIRMHYSIVHH